MQTWPLYLELELGCQLLHNLGITLDVFVSAKPHPIQIVMGTMLIQKVNRGGHGNLEAWSIVVQYRRINMDSLSRLVLAETVQELTKTASKKRPCQERWCKEKERREANYWVTKLNGTLGLHAGGSLHSRDTGTLSQSWAGMTARPPRKCSERWASYGRRL